MGYFIIKRIDSIIKLVNARDPPNKFFESTVNLANQDAWKRRSIYLSQANFQFEPQSTNNFRHSINNIGLRSTALLKDDSSDDWMYGNTDEGIGEMDRYIPMIGVPKCISALKDKFLPVGLQKMLRQSTRFSYSFHVGRDSKVSKRESSIQNNTNKNLTNKIIMNEELKVNLVKTWAKAKEFFKYSKESSSRSTSSDKDDNWNIIDDDWVQETSISYRCDNLNKYNINTMFSKWEFSSLKEEVKNLSLAFKNKRDSYVNKIEEIDQK